jgi:hypothetical protein
MSAEVEPPDLLQELHAAVLRATGLTYLVIGFLTSLAFVFMPMGQAPLAWAVRLGVGVLLACTGAVAVLFRGRWPLMVSRFLAMAPAAFLIAPAVVLGLGIRAATLPAGVVVVVIAGLLVSARSALIAAALLSSAFFALLVAEHRGWLSGATAQNLPPPLAWFISLSAR